MYVLIALFLYVSVAWCTSAESVARPLFSGVSYPDDRAAWAINAKGSGMLFAGAIGSRGGINPVVLKHSPHVLDSDWLEKSIEQLPTNHPYISGIRQVLKRANGQYKSQALSELGKLRSKGDLSVLSLASIAMWGTRPTELDATTKTWFEHTIVSGSYRRLSSLGAFLERDSVFSADYLKRMRGLDQTSLASDAANNTKKGTTSYYVHNRNRQEEVMNLLFYFGGKFGLTSWIESFAMGRAMCSVSSETYEAHGVRMDAFSGPIHDSAHAEVMAEATLKLVNRLEQYILDVFYAKGGNANGFDALHQKALPREMERFLSTIGALNAGAFRCWVAACGDVGEYKKFATALFLLTHEYPGFSEHAVLSTDFVGAVNTAIDRHLVYVRKNSQSWESPVDVLETCPATGKSCFESEVIIEKMLERNKETVLEFLRRSGLKIADDESDLAKWFSSTHLVFSDGGLFYDLTVCSRSGEKLVFTEPTLRFKALNYEDTKGLLSCAGIKLSSIGQDATRDDVMRVLQAGIDKWTQLMVHLKKQIAFLGSHIHNDRGESLSEWFLSTRYACLRNLGDRLKRGIQPEFALENHWIPSETYEKADTLFFR